MSAHGLALFCLVYLLATASPGPGTAAILARVLSHGTRGMAAFIAGVTLTLGNPKVMVFYRALRWLNRGSGTVMAGAAVAVATR